MAKTTRRRLFCTRINIIVIFSLIHIACLIKSKVIMSTVILREIETALNHILLQRILYCTALRTLPCKVDVFSPQVNQSNV